jgi:triacylglycerol lipase
MDWYDGIVRGWRCAWCDRLLPANESNGIDPGTCDCPAGLADAADYEGRAMKLSRLSIERPPPLHSQHPPFHRCEKPVLLLYGLFATPRIVGVLTHRFRRRGYCAFSINLGGLFGRFNSAPIEELAALLSNQVDRICRHHGLEWLDLVGHSQGGLIGRYYVQKLNGAKHVSSLVTLGTPHRGTPWAYLGRLVKQIIPSVPQMMPNSHFLRECTDRSFPGGVKMTSVFSRADLICPPSSCRLDAEVGPHLKNVEIPNGGHFDLLFRKDVFTVVERELQSVQERQSNTLWRRAGSRRRQDFGTRRSARFIEGAHRS